VTRTIEEGPLIVKAARENNRVCQVGMQQRSAKHYAHYFTLVFASLSRAAVMSSRSTIP
jgi:predicted dehydrogenase